MSLLLNKNYFPGTLCTFANLVIKPTILNGVLLAGYGF